MHDISSFFKITQNAKIAKNAPSSIAIFLSPTWRKWRFLAISSTFLAISSTLFGSKAHFFEKVLKVEHIFWRFEHTFCLESTLFGPKNDHFGGGGRTSCFSTGWSFCHFQNIKNGIFWSKAHFFGQKCARNGVKMCSKWLKMCSRGFSLLFFFSR